MAINDIVMVGKSLSGFSVLIVAFQHDNPVDPAAGLDVDERLAELYRGDASAFYSASWHRSLFTFPPALARALAGDLDPKLPRARKV